MAGNVNDAARRSRRQGGSASRRRVRQAGSDRHAVVGPSLKGGAFRPLSEQDVLRIHRTALDVLENVGIADPIPEMLDLALAKGCWLNEHDRLCFSRAFVEDVIAGASKEFTIYARDPAFNIELGGSKVSFSTAGQAVTIYEPKTKSYRPSILLDLYDMARLVDQLDNIHRFCQPIVATDIEDQYVHSMNIAYAIGNAQIIFLHHCPAGGYWASRGDV